MGRFSHVTLHHSRLASDRVCVLLQRRLESAEEPHAESGCAVRVLRRAVYQRRYDHCAHWRRFGSVWDFRQRLRQLDEAGSRELRAQLANSNGVRRAELTESEQIALEK